MLWFKKVAEADSEYTSGENMIIYRVLEALRRADSGTPLADSIGAMLFNLEVRQFNQVGDEVPFNFKLHQTAEGQALLPRSPAKVLSPGWQRKGEILKKATIEEAPNTPEKQAVEDEHNAKFNNMIDLGNKALAKGDLKGARGYFNEAGKLGKEFGMENTDAMFAVSDGHRSVDEAMKKAAW